MDARTAHGGGHAELHTSAMKHEEGINWNGRTDGRDMHTSAKQQDEPGKGNGCKNGACTRARCSTRWDRKIVDVRTGHAHAVHMSALQHGDEKVMDARTRQ